MRKLSMRDVAAEAGVGKDTVSNVFHERGGYTNETRDRVLAAAKKLGYEFHLSRPTAQASIGLRLAAGNTDPNTGFIGRARLVARAKVMGTSVTDEVLRMLTFADAHLPASRSKKKRVA